MNRHGIYIKMLHPASADEMVVGESTKIHLQCAPSFVNCANRNTTMSPVLHQWKRIK